MNLPSRPSGVLVVEAGKNWSNEQLDIFNFFATGSGNLVVEALAGTGKTTTIKEAFGHAPEQGRLLYAVFNKKNQIEAESKIKDRRVDVKTLHSLGFAFIKRVWFGAKPDDEVEWDRIDEVLRGVSIEFGAGNLANDRQFCGMVLKLVGFLKNLFVGMPTQEQAYTTAEERECLIGSAKADEKLVFAALRVLEVSKVKRADSRISFDDMVWLPVAMGWVRPSYDLVVIDEAQDMNMPQLMIARKAVKDGGRVVVVGDSRQAIYGFRGAVQDGMNMMRLQLRAAVLTLSTTYRCPKAVVRVAAQLVPNYNAAEGNAEGQVISVGEAKMLSDAKPGDVILSRLNAPLMPLALGFLRRNIPARIEGRDIGQQLIGMVRKFKASDLKDLVTKIDAWKQAQSLKLSGLRNAEKRIEQISDIASTLIAIAEASDSINDMTNRLESLFQDSNAKGARPAVVLSSVHKAKGLEWNRVYLLSATFRRGRGQEEDNIYYVAVTRAKETLAIVGGVEEAPEPVKTSPEVTSEPQPVSPEAPKTPETPSAEVREQVVPASTPVAPTAPASFKPGNWGVPAGMVRHEVGNVLLWGGFEYVVTRVNDSCARITCLEKSEKVIRTRFGAEKTIKCQERSTSIATNVEPSEILRRMSAEQLNNFLSGTKPVRSAEKQQSTKEESNNMEIKNKKGQTVKVSEAGSSKYVLGLFQEGMKEADARAQATKKFPFLSIDKCWNYRWDSAQKRTAKAKAKAKAAKTAPVAAKPTPKAKTGKGGKASTKPAAKPSRKPSAKKNAEPVAAAPLATPPPRPSPAPAATEAPETAPVQA